MTNTPTTEPAESLDDLRQQLTFARDLVDALERTIASAEADEFTSDAEHGPVYSPSDRDLIDALAVRVDAIEQAQLTSQPFDERALDETDAMLDMTGAFVSSTAAVLRIRAEINAKHEQAKARWLAVQHGGRPAERARAMGRHDTWQEALRLIDNIIAERMS